MEKKQIIASVESYVKKKFGKESSGHDWWHIHRVRNSALEIGEKEKADLFVVELAALLHDIADWKFHKSPTAGSEASRKILEKYSVEEEVIAHVCNIVDNVSFKGSKVKSKIKTIEGKVVQDADRLDAIGAIGIARAFAYGGYKGRSMYNPDISPENLETFEQYKKGSGSTVNHFYEKLLLLKDRMNTKTAKRIAKNRHKFMKKYLDQFYEEWKGKG